MANYLLNWFSWLQASLLPGPSLLTYLNQNSRFKRPNLDSAQKTTLEMIYLIPLKHCHILFTSFIQTWYVKNSRRSSFIEMNFQPSPYKAKPLQPRCEFRSAARVGPSGHDWPYSCDQGLVIIDGPTVIVLVLRTLAANTGNQRCARPSA